MTRHDRQPPSPEIALDQLEVGSAHSTGGDLEDELSCRRLRIGELDQLQRRRRCHCRLVKLQSQHRTTVPQFDRAPIGRTALAKAPFGTRGAAGMSPLFDRR